MSETDAGKKAERLERPRRIGGGTAEGTGRARQTDTARAEQTGDGALVSMEAVVRRENVTAVYQRVVRNGGAPGVDGVTVDELKAYCQTHWDRIRQELLDGRYQPQPIRKVEIPKPEGGQRRLGIPTVMDRMIHRRCCRSCNYSSTRRFRTTAMAFVRNAARIKRYSAPRNHPGRV